MQSADKITYWATFLSAFAATVLAGLISFDWLTYFDAKTALKIVGSINLVNIFAQGWIKTATMMAQSMTAAKTEIK